MAEKPQQPQLHGGDQKHLILSCSVCLDLLVEPVTISCGHSYCRQCIEGFWDRAERMKQRYRCPQCRESFAPRPVLRKNNMLNEVVEELKMTSLQPSSPAEPTGSPAGNTGVSCDFCVGPDRDQASMSCLTCLVSAVSALRARTEDLLAINETKVQDKLFQRERELNELSQAEDELKDCAKAVLKDCDVIFAQSISKLQQKQDKVKQLILIQEKVAADQAKKIRLKLKEEICDLKTRETKLKELKESEADDHIHSMQTFQCLLNECNSTDIAFSTNVVRDFKNVTSCVTELSEEVELMVKKQWHKISTAVSYVNFPLEPAPKTREDFLQYCCPLMLDITTNYPNLHLISENLRMKPSPAPYAAHPDRFKKFPQVLCTEGLSDRCYWEVEGHGRTLTAAVAYKDVPRKSRNAQFGKNSKSWSLDCSANVCVLRHNNKETEVRGFDCKKIGVYLDYKAGTLCFYHVAESMVLLHKVQTTFTEPLYPGIGLNYEWYDVGVFAQIVKLW